MEVIYNGNNDWRDYCLAHHGIMGMHWGIRRFQPYSVTGPRKGGKTGKEVGIAKRIGNGIGAGVKRIKTAHKNRVVAKKRAAALEKARKVKAEKEEIMKSGDAEKLLARKELFSNDDIDKFLTRADKETKVAELKKRQIEAGFQKADEIQEKVRKIAGYVKTANDLASEGIKLKQNFDQAAEMMGASKKKAAEKEADRITNSGSAEEVLNAIRTGKLDASHTQTAKNRLDNQANIEKRILDDGKKAAEEAAERLVNSGSAADVLNGSKSGALTADQTQKALTRLNNQKSLEGLLNKDPSDIEKAINNADAAAISKNWGAMTSAQKKEAFESVTKKQTIDKAIPKEDTKKTDNTESKTKETPSESRTIKGLEFNNISGNNNKWTNLGVQGARHNNPYTTQPKDKVEGFLRREYRDMFADPGTKWGNQDIKGGSYKGGKPTGINENSSTNLKNSNINAASYKSKQETGSNSSSRTTDLVRQAPTRETSKIGGSSYNQRSLPMKGQSNGSSRPKPKTIDAEVVNGKAIPVGERSRPALPGPTSSSSSKSRSTSSTGPLTLNPSASSRDYNKRATEGLKSLSKKASELSKQTRDVDSGEDWVRDILSKRG